MKRLDGSSVSTEYRRSYPQRLLDHFVQKLHLPDGAPVDVGGLLGKSHVLVEEAERGELLLAHVECIGTTGYHADAGGDGGRGGEVAGEHQLDGHVLQSQVVDLVRFVLVSVSC